MKNRLQMKRRTTLLYLTVVFWAIKFTCMAASGNTIVNAGKAECSIVLSPMASPSARLAAEELNAYVKKISGVTLPVRTEITENRLHHQPLARHDSDFEWDTKETYKSSWNRTHKPTEVTHRCIVIGTIDSLTPIPRAVKTKLEKCNSNEAFYIKSEGNNIFVIGKKPIGALYGTYALLEEYFGVCWFHPGELGEHCPKTTTIILPKIDNFQKPDIATRLRRGGRGPYHYYETSIWDARNKMQVRATTPLRWFEAGRCTKERHEFLCKAMNATHGRGGHLIFELAVPDELFKEHPEYFTLKDGKRKFGGRLQRCLANPDVFKRVLEYGEKWCGKNKDNLLYISSHDSRDSWCECEECIKMGTVDGKFKVTNLYHRFFSKIVDSIIKRNPEARIDIYFYIDYGVAPDDKTIRYKGKNVRGVYCTCFPHSRCYAHNLTDSKCEPNRKCWKDLKGVLAICPNLFTFEYLCNSGVKYVPVWKTTAQDIKDLAKLGGVGYMDITHADKWLARWPSLYVGAKLQWNTSLDAEKLMDEAYDKYYGKAAPAMKKYQALRMKLWNNAPGHVFYGGPNRSAFCLTVPGAEKELNSYLAEAEKLAADDKVTLKRIAMDRDFLNRFWKADAEKLKKSFSSEKQIIPERSTEKIVVDGDLTENVWLKARPVTGFFKINTKQAPTQENSFRVAYDNDNLYIAFVAMNNKAWSKEIDKMQTKDGREIWSDDHIELEIAPPSSNDRFYHICINTKGLVYDSEMVGANIDKKYDSQAEVKVKKLADRFIYEIRLPLGPMKSKIEPGKAWSMFCLRTANNLQPPNNKETSSLDGNYPHRLMEFRRITFGNNIIKNGNFSDKVDKEKKHKGVTGDTFIKHWGVNAQECEVLDKDAQNKLRLKNGVVYSFLNIPKRKKNGKIAGEILVSGSGELNLKTSTCIRKPDGTFKGKPFSHSIKKKIGSFKLTKEPKLFNFETELAPYETGYIYVSVNGEAIVNNISGVISDK